jgi:hypothetical protein
VTPELEQVAFRQVAPPRGALPGTQLWELIAPDGTGVFAWAEVYPGEVQWGVRLQDRAPALEDDDLLRLVAKLLIWHVHCRADTVDVVLGRTHAHHPLVRVGGAYM